MLGTDRPSEHISSAKVGAALLAAIGLLLLVAPHAGAVAYYLGGGKGVRLAVRVVDHKIVWAKVRVREHCYSTRRGNYDRVEAFESLIRPVAIGRRGAFSWNFESRKHTKKGFRSVTVQNISGRIGTERLDGRVLYYSWFSFPDAGTHVHGNCRGGSESRPSEPPVPVPVALHRRPEPSGVAFYYGEKKKGITTLFEVRGRRIVKAQTWARLYCTDRSGRRYFDIETKNWPTPIKVRPSGRFEKGEAGEELPLESLRGQVTPSRITGSYGYIYANGEEGRCRTGSFEPGPGRRWAVPFVAPRR